MATIMPKNVLTPHTTANNETISSRVFISLLARIDRLIVKAIAFHAHGQKIQQHCTTIRRLFTKNKLVIIKLSDRHIKH
jgi:L-cystine uptake protein TcyP (sodium:dicarboxylate symporter family)